MLARACFKDAIMALRGFRQQQALVAAQRCARDFSGSSSAAADADGSGTLSHVFDDQGIVGSFTPGKLYNVCQFLVAS